MATTGYRHLLIAAPYACVWLVLVYVGPTLERPVLTQTSSVLFDAARVALESVILFWAVFGCWALPARLPISAAAFIVLVRIAGGSRTTESIMEFIAGLFLLLLLWCLHRFLELRPPWPHREERRLNIARLFMIVTCCGLIIVVCKDVNPQGIDFAIERWDLLIGVMTGPRLSDYGLLFPVALYLAFATTSTGRIAAGLLWGAIAISFQPTVNTLMARLIYDPGLFTRYNVRDPAYLALATTGLVWLRFCGYRLVRRPPAPRDGP